MKWTHKGHEFDLTSVKFDGLRTIYIFGTGKIGIHMSRALGPLNYQIIFIDSDEGKAGKQLEGYPIINVRDFILHEKVDGEIVIVAVKDEDSSIYIQNMLYRTGRVRDREFFGYSEFIYFYLPILYAYQHNKVFIKSLDMSITEICTLNCEKCCVSTPHIKNPKHRDMEKVFDDLDTLFDHVDYINSFIIYGGEPFTYPELGKVIDYIGKEKGYRKRMSYLSVYTNATLIPDDEIIERMKEFDISVLVSDYSKEVPRIREKVEQFKLLLEERGIRYTVTSDDWCDFGFGAIENQLTGEDLTAFATACYNCCVSCRSYENHTIYSCRMAQKAEQVLTGSVSDPANQFCLDREIPDYARQVCEFCMGYMENGYLEMCKKCNGWIPQNHLIPAGKQIKKG